MFYFSWELNSNWADFGPWFASHLWIPMTLSVIYVAAVHLGQHYMQSRPAFDLKKPLIWWNGFLTILSWAMAIRLTPLLISQLWNQGFRYSVCTPDFTQAPVGVWVMIFAASKLPELVDTAFLVLRKKEVILLHWYHHWTVMTYSWHSYGVRQSTGLWFQVMNAIIHSFMYFYYTLTSMGYRPKWNMILTAGQIIQMIVGTAISLNDLFNTGCGDKFNSQMGTLMYFSYFILFAHLFYDMYIVKKKGQGRVAADSKDKSTANATKAVATNGAASHTPAPAVVRTKSKKAE